MSELALNPDDLQIAGGQRVVLLESIGRGHDAIVFKGLVPGTHRLVAVKLFDGAPLDTHARNRIARAAQRTASFVNPGIVAVYDAVVPERATPFVVMELVRGVSLQTLAATWQPGGAPLEIALLVGLRVAEALRAALFHRLPDGSAVDLVHGALSPRDVLVTAAGEVKVGDFGMGHLAKATSMVRSYESVLHECATMAPEVANGGSPDARADVFALGVILSELLVGSRFTGAATGADVMRRVREGFVPPPLFAADVPNALRALLARTVAPDPEHRLPHAGVLAEELRRLFAPLGVREDAALLGAACAETMTRVASLPTFL